jgi:hypothetical protein
MRINEICSTQTSTLLISVIGDSAHVKSIISFVPHIGQRLYVSCFSGIPITSLEFIEVLNLGGGIFMYLFMGRDFSELLPLPDILSPR